MENPLMSNNNQRKGSKSNADAGNKFELLVKEKLEERFSSRFIQSVGLLIGVDGKAKHKHVFDLCSEDKIDNKYILVECKSHTWTEGGNVPSAKLTTWNQEMYHFSLIDNVANYRCMLVVLKSKHPSRDETLAQYYSRVRNHLIPKYVEILELDEQNGELLSVASQ